MGTNALQARTHKVCIALEVMGTQVVKSGNKNPKVGTRVGTKWEQSGNKNPKVGQEWEQSGNKPVGTRTPKWDKNGNKVGTKWESKVGTRTKWEQSGNFFKNPKWDFEYGTKCGT